MTETPESKLARGGGEVVQLPPRRDIHVLSPRECALATLRPYVVKGILSRGDHGGLIGLPGSAKSALAPYIGYRVALGLDVFGHRTKSVPVLYIAAEDGSGMKQRVRALFEIMGDAPGFHLQPVPVDFLDASSGHVAEIEGLIKRLSAGLVILDTIARSFPGLPENDPDAMGKVVKVARIFTTTNDCAMLSVHHPPKDAMTPRGHSVLNGDLDVTLYLEGERDQPRTVTMGKNRNGPSDLTFTFGLTSYQLGTDADGDPVTAPVVEPAVRDAKATQAAAKEARLSDRCATLLRELRALIDRAGQMVCPGEEYPTLRAVTRVSLRARLIESGWFSDDLLCTGSATVPCTASEKRAGLVRKAFAVENNALTPLKRNGFIAFNREWIWTL